MKTVGKQLQEARLAKNWTPELASRETKIKVDRVKDLEADDYTHFNNATYARGFVRTYARALGLDEYKILRQLDNKLPDDDPANIVSAEGGVAYLPETALPPRVAHRDFTGLYVVMGLGAVVLMVMAFVLFRAYQVGELGHLSGSDTAAAAPATTNAVTSSDEMAARAKPIDSDTPPPIPTAEPVQKNAVATAPGPDDSTANAPKALPVVLNAAGTPEPTTAGTTPALDSTMTTTPKALPVDPSTLSSAQTVQPTQTPPPADIPQKPLRALPVNPADLNSVPATATDPAATKAPPRALPVSAADLAATSANPPTTTDSTPAAGNGPVVLPPPTTTDDSGKPLVLTASRDSFVRVTMLDTSSGAKQVYADVLHGGQSVGFNGHKFSVTVNDPSAVNITLDSVNYGPHDDHGSAPETFTVVSHVQ